MKTAGRENPNRWATIAQQPSTWRGRSEQILLIQVGCEQERFQPPGTFSFLTSLFIELHRTNPAVEAG
jgi:hypothetical protein